MVNISENNILSNITLLYVEDEENTRIELSRYLKRRVGRLIVASDGEEGIELITRYRPDIVITDLKMPGISGLEMLRTVRGEGFEGGFIVTSAVSDSSLILEAMDLGVVKYMVKPVDTGKLNEYLNDISEEIIKDKTDGMVFGHNYILDREQKKEMEEMIKSKVAYFIKKYTGKGPRNIRVFIQADMITIDAEEVLTTFEQSIMVSIENYSLIEYVRRVFYLENKNAFEKAISEEVRADVKLESIASDSKKNIDTIKFSIV